MANFSKRECKQMVGAWAILNLADMGFTAWYVGHGLADEANLLMKFVLSHSVVGFIILKLLVTLIGGIVLYSFSRRRNTIPILPVILGFYGVVVFEWISFALRSL